MAGLTDYVDGEAGYFRGLCFSDAELDVVRSIIRKKWLANLSALRPDSTSLFEATPIQGYHRIAHLVEHGKAWTKHSRIFSEAEVDQIRGLSFFDKLAERVGRFEIADIEGLGYPEVYWRLVRPGQASDVAGAHTDAWFYSYTNNLNADQQRGLVKVWIAICVQPGESGLSVLPGSHRVDWPNFSEVRDGRPKPVLGVPQETLDLINLDTAPGEAVVFNTRLLHAGIAHVGDHSRVSIEFAIRILD